MCRSPSGSLLPSPTGTGSHRNTRPRVELRFAFVAALLCATTPAAAQARLEATPYIGVYMPIGILIEDLDANNEPHLRVREVGGLLTGGRLGLQLDGLFSIEVGVAQSRTDLEVREPYRTLDYSSRVLLGAVRTPLRLPVGHGVTFHIAPGIAVVSRDGEAWGGYTGTVDIAALGSVGARFAIGRGLAFRVEIEDYLTRAHFNEGLLTETRPKLHHALAWSFGAALTLAGAREPRQ
jgi:hypothetical protein